MIFAPAATAFWTTASSRVDGEEPVGTLDPLQLHVANLEELDVRVRHQLVHASA
jgi:hypothetical protein